MNTMVSHSFCKKIIDCGGWSLFQMVGGCMVRPLSHHQPTVNSPHQASDPPGAEVTNAPGPSADRWSLGLSSDFLAVVFFGSGKGLASWLKMGDSSQLWPSF